MPFNSRAAASAEFKSLMQGDKEGLREFPRRVRVLGDVGIANMGGQRRDDLNCEHRIFGVELQELLLREEFEDFSQAVARSQFLEVANKIVRARSRRQPNYVRELESVSDLMSGVVRGGVEVGDKQQVRAELPGLQTSTDQRVDQIATQMRMQGSRQSNMAKKIKMVNWRYDELMTGMRATTDQRWICRCRI